MRFGIHTNFLHRMRCADLLCGSALLVVGVISAIGCSDAAKNPAEQQVGVGHEAGDAEHGHAEAGPHNGQLIELGNEEYHGEFLHDDAVHKITIYLLDGAAKKGVPIGDKELTLNVVVDGKPAQYKLAAVPQADDPAGQSSRYESVDQALCEALDDPKCKGRFNVTIAGKQFSGDIAPHDHDDHK